MIKILIEKSINSAVNQDWFAAIDINLEILRCHPYHIPTLNRLAKAYRETGQIDKAVKTYEQTLRFDKYNSIALKNLRLLKSLPQHNNCQGNGKQYSCDFIDEPGLTRNLPLVRLGDPGLLSSLEAGQVVDLNNHGRAICVLTHSQEHIGALTDDVAYHLHRFLDKGYQYLSIIKFSQPSKVIIFIKETHRPQTYQQCPTFVF